jgi:hypothetical protein
MLRLTCTSLGPVFLLRNCRDGMRTEKEIKSIGHV